MVHGVQIGKGGGGCYAQGSGMPESIPEYLKECLGSSFLNTWTEDSEVNVAGRKFHKREVLNKKKVIRMLPGPWGR